jgi:hypothetical protein
MAVSDEEVVAELTAGGMSVADFFLIDGLICFVNARGVLMARVHSDPASAAATKAYLRRVGTPEYPSWEAYHARDATRP